MEDTNLENQINDIEFCDLGILRRDIYGDDDKFASKRVVFAKTNIGANIETEFGRYFRWGETYGWKINAPQEDHKDEISFFSGLGLNPSNCEQISMDEPEIYNSMTFHHAGWKYCNIELDDLFINSSFFTASINCGKPWRLMDFEIIRKFFCIHMPGEIKIGSVILDVAWKDNYNETSTNGIEIRNSQMNTHIFLPAAGVLAYGKREESGELGIYWGNAQDGPFNGESIKFNRNELEYWGYNKACGGQIRLVADID